MPSIKEIELCKDSNDLGENILTHLLDVQKASWPELERLDVRKTYQMQEKTKSRKYLAYA